MCDQATALFKWHWLDACLVNPLSFSNAVFQLLKPCLVKTKSLSLFSPNLRQGKQKHSSSFAEYSSHGLPRYRPELNACAIWPKWRLGKTRMVCDGARLYKPWFVSAIAAPRMLSGGAVLVQLGWGSGFGLSWGAVPWDDTMEPASVDCGPVAVRLQGLATRNRCMLTEKKRTIQYSKHSEWNTKN